MSRPLAMRSWPRWVAVASLAVPAAAFAQDAEPSIRAIPTSTMLGFERIKLPQGERLGLVGTSVLFEATDSLGVGPVVYGAATGERGGFFVGGIEAQHRLALRPGLALATGLFAGGGGGGGAPVGGGLMLRPAATLLWDIGSTLQAGLSWSMVKFPSGQIDSRQFGLVLAWRDRFRHYDVDSESRPVDAPLATGLGFDRIAATGGVYRLSGGEGSIGLAGARADRRTGLPGVILSMEAAGAASGRASGYMEILGGAGWSTAPFEASAPSLRIGLRGALGLGGGGAVATGGGTLAKVTATLEVGVGPGWTAGVEAGRVHALNGSMRASHAQAWLATDLEPGLDGRSEPRSPVIRGEWTGAIQHHTHVLRKDGRTASLDTLGLKLSRYVTPHVYLAGQAHSAFAGGAGAYSVGLLGLGVASRAGDGPRIGAEALVGAAGGGGVATAGGAIAQAIVWAGLGTPARGEWRVGVGTVRALRGDMRSPSIELSWTKAFGLSNR